MDIVISKKRGRPKSTVVTMPILRRVPEDLIEVVDGYLDAAIKARRENNLKSIDEWFKKVYGWSRPEPALNQPPSKEAHQAVSYLTEISELKANTQALLDDVERLTRELDEEKAKVKRALDLDLDAKGKLGWKLYFQLKEGTGKGEFDQT